MNILKYTRTLIIKSHKTSRNHFSFRPITFRQIPIAISSPGSTIYVLSLSGWSLICYSLISCWIESTHFHLNCWSLLAERDYSLIFRKCKSILDSFMDLSRQKTNTFICVHIMRIVLQSFMQFAELVGWQNRMSVCSNWNATLLVKESD